MKGGGDCRLSLEVRSIGTLQEYNMDLSQIYNWLPWGGLIYPQVVRNKDNSLMGFIRYNTVLDVEAPDEQPMQIHEFPKGWAIWVELQHFNSGNDIKILTLCWHPFRDKKSGKILNSLDGKDYLPAEAESHFITVLQQLQQDLATVVHAEILEYEQVLSYLTSTLTGESSSVEMYSPPLYLDAVLSRDIDFQVFSSNTAKKNAVAINGREITAVTPMGFPKMPIMGILFKAFCDFDYRFVKRFLFWDAAGAEQELKGYMKGWCQNRTSIKDYMSQNLLMKFNGVYTNTFVFRFTDQNRAKNEAYIAKVLETLELPYVFEEFNRKHCWWGTVPGCFRANIVPPIKGIQRLGDLLVFTEAIENV